MQEDSKAELHCLLYVHKGIEAGEARLSCSRMVLNVDAELKHTEIRALQFSKSRVHIVNNV